MVDYDSALNKMVWSADKCTEQWNTKHRSWIAGSLICSGEKFTCSQKPYSSAWRQVRTENLSQITWFRLSAFGQKSKYPGCLDLRGSPPAILICYCNLLRLIPLYLASVTRQLSSTQAECLVEAASTVAEFSWPFYLPIRTNGSEDDSISRQTIRI